MIASNLFLSTIPAIHSRQSFADVPQNYEAMSNPDSRITSSTTVAYYSLGD